MTFQLQCPLADCPWHYTYSQLTSAIRGFTLHLQGHHYIDAAGSAIQYVTSTRILAKQNLLQTLSASAICSTNPSPRR